MHVSQKRWHDLRKLKLAVNATTAPLLTIIGTEF